MRPRIHGKRAAVCSIRSWRATTAEAACMLVLTFSACGPSPTDEPGHPTADETAPTDSLLANKKLVGQFIATATPGVPGWHFEPVPTADVSADGVSSRSMALTGFGDEAVPVTIGTQVALANCGDGTCGGKCSAPAEVPAWQVGYCLPGEAVAQGKVSLTNLTSESYLIEPVAVFSNLQPASLEFFSAFPAPFTFTCDAYAQTRTADPLNGAYYVRYNDLAPGDCDDGMDLWITAPTLEADANTQQLFYISIYAEALEPTNVLNGGFESGLDNWTTSTSVGVQTISEHCSHESDFNCGVSEDGVLAPVGTSMARLTTIDGGATPAYAAYLQSAQVSLQAASSLTFRSKMGTREAANFCAAGRDDTWYVEARKNSGSWVRLPLPNPPDADNDSTVETVDDCANFNEISLAAVFEQAWNPGSALSPQDFQTVTIDLSAAPLSATTGDKVDFRFWVVGGAPAQLGASVFLLDAVSIVAN